MVYMIFQYGREPGLVQRISTGLDLPFFWFVVVYQRQNLTVSHLYGGILHRGWLRYPGIGKQLILGSHMIM